MSVKVVFFFQAEDGIRDGRVTGVQTCALPISIVVAHDGVEALDCVFGTGSFKNDPVAPVVVLLDLKLPKIDGLEVLRRIRADARTRLLPVVILTSSKEERSEERRVGKECRYSW